MSTSVVEDTSMNTADRCDRCGAQAYVRVTLPGGSELLFCGHHSNEHHAKLKEVATDIHDESSKIS